jgi:hypothetical protein
MAAITPHVGSDEAFSESETAYANCGAGAAREVARSYGLGEVGESCPLPGEMVGVNHSELMTLASVREWIAQVLATRSVHVESQGTATGVEYRLVFDKPISVEESPPWSPMTSAVSYVKILSWTTKMACPSFSLPAGVEQIGGSCVGALGGQSVAPIAAFKKQEKLALKVVYGTDNRPPGVDVASAVCEHCYATGGNYVYADQAIRMLTRMAWTKAAVKDGTFVRTMIDAIDNADYRIGGFVDTRSKKETLPEPDYWGEMRFFRLHDSGDFYNREYLAAWKEIANAFVPGNPEGREPIMFWAPTRIWATTWGSDDIRKVNGGTPDNLIIRASGYWLNTPAPEFTEVYDDGSVSTDSGYASASTVYADGPAEAVLEGTLPAEFEWDCQAYAVEGGPNCRGAVNPEGNLGCRACWMRPDLITNYRAH